MNVKASRHPAVDMRTITDVPTLACVEMSREILLRPEMNTKTFFSTIVASREDVNKSDAVIMIAAAILEHIGNKRAATSILSKSRSVTEFYKVMRLDDSRLREAFVVLLFAVAPEFVKMIESSLKIALERVQDVTDAPHADTKLLLATGELARSNTVSQSEYSSLLKDVTKMRISTVKDSPSDDNSYILSAEVRANDSISRVGAARSTVTDQRFTSADIMKYIKEQRTGAKKEFYDAFPSVTRPISESVSFNKTRTGLGFSGSASAVANDGSKSEFSEVMNKLLPKHAPRNRRKLSEADKIVFNRARMDSVTDSRSTNSFETAINEITSPFTEPINVNDFLVTAEDIAEDKKNKDREEFCYSAPVAASESAESLASLMDLV